MKIEPGKIWVNAGEIDPQELRFSTLLWDKLVWPYTETLHVTGGADEIFLQNEGILFRPDYTVRGDDTAACLIQAYINAFNDLNSKNPGCWSVAYGEKSLQIPDWLVDKNNKSQIEIYRAIPVPDKDVHLNDVLEFRLRRRDELGVLRTELDSLVSALTQSSGNHKSVLASQIDAIDIACANAIRVSKEWQFPVRLSSFKCSFEVRPFEIALGAITGFSLAEAMGLPKTTSVVSAAGGALYTMRSALKLSADSVTLRGLRPQRGPYDYVTRFHQELF